MCDAPSFAHAWQRRHTRASYRCPKHAEHCFLCRAWTKGTTDAHASQGLLQPVAAPITLPLWILLSVDVTAAAAGGAAAAGVVPSHPVKARQEGVGGRLGPFTTAALSQQQLHMPFGARKLLQLFALPNSWPGGGGR